MLQVSAEPQSYVSYKWRFKKNYVEFKRLCAVYYRLSPRTTPVKKCIPIFIQNFNSAYVHRYNNVCMLSRRSTIPNENILVVQWKYAQPRITKNKKSKCQTLFYLIMNPGYSFDFFRKWTLFCLLSRLIFVQRGLRKLRIRAVFSRAESDQRHLWLCITITMYLSGFQFNVFSPNANQ